MRLFIDDIVLESCKSKKQFEKQLILLNGDSFFETEEFREFKNLQFKSKITKDEGIYYIKKDKNLIGIIYYYFKEKYVVNFKIQTEMKSLKNIISKIIENINIKFKGTFFSVFKKNNSLDELFFEMNFKKEEYFYNLKLKQREWGEKPYKSFDYEMKSILGEKVRKLSLDGGFSCPNRDGKISTLGCIFCSDSGSGEFAGSRKNSISKQINEQIEFLGKKAKDKKYIAYFQNFTNTYGDIEYLREIYYEAISHEDVIGISIATRADCLDHEVIELLDELNKKTFLWLELGLQTIHDKSAKLINRGYKYSVFLDSFEKLKKKNIRAVVHLIIGIPNESKEDYLDTIREISKLKPWGVKLHMLYILRNSLLHKLYEKEPWHILSEEEYLDYLCDSISLLSQEISIHRLTGDAPKGELVEPIYRPKIDLLNKLSKKLRKDNIYQGKLLKEI